MILSILRRLCHGDIYNASLLETILYKVLSSFTFVFLSLRQNKEDTSKFKVSHRYEEKRAGWKDQWKCINQASGIIIGSIKYLGKEI